MPPEGASSDQGEVEQDMSRESRVPIHINDIVSVRLTDFGRAILQEQGRTPKEDEEGWYSEQLWVLMGLLGHRMHLTGPLVFEPELFLEPETIQGIRYCKVCPECGSKEVTQEGNQCRCQGCQHDWTEGVLNPSEEHQQVAALLALYIDLAWDVVEGMVKDPDDAPKEVSKLYKQMRLLKRQRDDIINDPKKRQSSFRSSSMLFNLRKGG